MQCISPMSIRKKGVRRPYNITVPCGKCPECLQSKRADWSFRLFQEYRESKTSAFVTLTYDDENIGKRSVEKRHLQLFLKRLRNEINEVNGKGRNKTKVSQKACKVPKFKYFITGEYGGKFGRPHYHALFFNIPKGVDVQKFWDYGFCHVGFISGGSIHYVAKYCINRLSELKEGKNKVFSIMSKGIGEGYVKRAYNWHKKEKRYYVISEKGVKQRLPRFYKDKLFSILENEGHRKEVEVKLDNEFNENYRKSCESGDKFFEAELARKKHTEGKFKEINKKDKL